MSVASLRLIHEGLSVLVIELPLTLRDLPVLGSSPIVYKRPVQEHIIRIESNNVENLQQILLSIYTCIFFFITSTLSLSLPLSLSLSLSFFLIFLSLFIFSFSIRVISLFNCFFSFKIFKDVSFFLFTHTRACAHTHNSTKLNQVNYFLFAKIIFSFPSLISLV